jgi:hypothetical protein
MKNLQFQKTVVKIMIVEIVNYQKGRTEIVFKTIINHLF